MDRDALAADVVARAVREAEEGLDQKADETLRRAVHAGLRPIEVVLAALVMRPRAISPLPQRKESTMRVVYDGPELGVHLAPALGDIWLPQGTPVEVPDEVGRSLCEQPHFRRVRSRKETPGDPRAGTETPERDDTTEIR